MKTQLVHTKEELRLLLDKETSVGFVPTMGALHNGHCSLLREARKENQCVVLSIFVNPKQFGEGEDFDSYPRTLDSDFSIAEEEQVNIVFVPTVETMYPSGFATIVDVPQVAAPLCGSNRPGHFQGVATVVNRLFGLVRPNRAYLGLKDLQQCMVLQRMVKDLELPVELRLCETVREDSGLALSSRNQYLSEEDTIAAAAIYRSLKEVSEKYQQGELSSSRLVQFGLDILNESGAFDVEYFEIRTVPNLESIETLASNLSTPSSLSGYACAGAVRLGQTRLIVNILLL